VNKKLLEICTTVVYIIRIEAAISPPFMNGQFNYQACDDRSSHVDS